MTFTMNDIDKLNLQKLIKQNDVKDTTDEIRIKRHSFPIKQDIQRLIVLKNTHNELFKNNFNEFENMCINECQFLFNKYTDIFNKILKNELDLNLFGRFLEILKKIEDGDIDQHTGSFQVGSILKQIYVDSALRRSESLKNGVNNSSENDVNKSLVEPKNISWNEWKNKN
jgi:hypothetical protein